MYIIPHIGLYTIHILSHTLLILFVECPICTIHVMSINCMYTIHEFYPCIAYYLAMYTILYIAFKVFIYYYVCYPYTTIYVAYIRPCIPSIFYLVYFPFTACILSIKYSIHHPYNVHILSHVLYSYVYRYIFNYMYTYTCICMCIRMHIHMGGQHSICSLLRKLA
jgi:hypothetical protein